MDHRVSKDMISQGMSFAGEKTTEDLNSTQIGKGASPHSLMGAYQSIYEKKEQVDEIVVSGTLAALGGLAAKAGGALAAKTAAAGGAKAVAGKALGTVAKNAALEKATSTVANIGSGNKEKEPTRKAGSTVSTVAASHELDGDVLKELKASGLFSEEELNNILAKEDMNKGYVVTNADKKANTPAWQGYKAGKKKKDGSPLYTAADHLKKDK